MFRSALKNHRLVSHLTSQMFMLTGRDPSTRWYTHYKANQLKLALQQAFDEEQLPIGFGLDLDERVVEYPWMFSRLPAGPGRLLDAGSVLNFDYVLQHPRLAEKELTIATLAPELYCAWQRGTSYVYGDLRETCFRADYFDHVVCLSTLEHIGLDNTLFYTGDTSKREEERSGYLRAVTELRRILKPGGLCLISVPYGESSIRSWLQVFDSGMIDSVLQTFQPSHYAITYFQYSAQAGWRLSSRESAANAKYFDIHFDEPWSGCPVAAEAVACLELKR